MISRKTISGLLTSASLATLAIAASSRASAASLTTTNSVVNWTTDTDFLNINSSDIGTFTNDATISDGFENPGGSSSANALVVSPDSTIGEIINSSSGTIQGIEDALGNHGSTSDANAYGIWVLGRVDEITNEGLIDAYAFAHDFGTTDAYAEADALGIDLDPELDNYTNAITNDGTISAWAGVDVYDTDDGEGFVSAGAVHQSADGAGAHDLWFLNNADMTVGAKIEVEADDEANANGLASGLEQYAFDGSSTSLWAKNAGDMTVGIEGLAVVDEGYAGATYIAGVGITQYADGLDESYPVNVKARNTGTMDISVMSEARATYGEAYSLGLGAGILQEASGTPANIYAKNKGDISVNVLSKANVAIAGTYATAYAVAGGVNQLADGYDFSPPGSAGIVELENLGSLDVVAQSIASGNATYVTGYSAAIGSNQRVEDFETGAAYATNSGQLSVMADVKATSGGTYTTGYGSAIGAIQDVDAFDEGVPTMVSSGMTDYQNSGSFSVVSNVVSGDESTPHFVFASSNADGLQQEIDDAATMQATFLNTEEGEFSVIANADATSFDNGDEEFYINSFAISGADADGVEQYVEGYGSDDPGLFAKAQIKNYGDFLVSANATAKAGTYAAAGATAEGVEQYVEYADTAKTQFVNGGSFAVTAEAMSEADFFAVAFADSFGVSQEAYNYGGGDTLLKLSQNKFKNESDFLVAASASAENTYAAEVFAFAGGVSQYAEDSDLNKNLYKNTGDVMVSAEAMGKGLFALGGAQAVGTYQTAYGELNSDIQSATNWNKYVNNGSVMVSGYSEMEGNTYAGSNARSGGVSQYAENSLSNRNVFSNTGTFGVYSESWAASGRFGLAFSGATGFRQDIYNNYGTGYSGIDNLNSFENSGKFTVSAFSKGVGGTYAGFAGASAYGGDQDAEYGLNNQNVFKNTGTFSVMAEAKAKSDGFASADAEAEALDQYAYGISNYYTYDLPVPVLSENSFKNTHNFLASALAQSTGGTYAMGDAYAGGLYQNAYYANSNYNRFVNTGSFDVMSETSSLAANYAFAGSGVEGLYQYAYGYSYYNDEDDNGRSAVSQNIAKNTGSMYLSSFSKAVGNTYAGAYAGGEGVDQNANYAASNFNKFANTGSFMLASKARAKSNGFATAYGSSDGVDQYAYGYSNYTIGVGYHFNNTNKNVFKNKGLFSVSQESIAGGRNGGTASYAMAGAYAYGVYQETDQGLAGLNSFKNSSSIDVSSYGKATGDFAIASAYASGYESYGDRLRSSYISQFRNKSGAEIWSMATAEANGTDYGLASAYASGVEFDSDNYYYDPVADESVQGAALELDGKNKGLIYAFAEASASATDPVNEYAVANAFGVSMYSPTGLTGTFENTGSGSIYAGATADAADGIAWAVGVYDPSTANAAKIINKGDITAYAEGPQAYATGIAVAGMSTYADGPLAIDPADAVAVIKNDGGSIWAGISTDGGKTILRGNAINTDGLVVGEGDAEVILSEVAPNAVIVRLQNTQSDDPAQIFGNIDITDDDTIVVQKGWTRLDGVINPDMELSGDLIIDTDGKLTMANTNDIEGPSMGYVDNFTVTSQSILNYELDADSSPKIWANNVELDGKFVATYLPDLYGDRTVYNNVINGEALSGKFSKVMDNSALLNTKLRYDGGDNVDIIAKRTGFGDVKGLTKNQQAVGDAIESVYGDLNGKGNFSDLTQTLFTLDEGDYSDAMNQLTGAEYAQLAQSVLWSTTMLNSSVTDRMDCGLNWTPGAGSSGERGPDACFEPGTIQMWGRISGSWNTNDGDSYAPGFDESQSGFLVGGDYAINDNWFVGLAGGYFSSDMDFDRWGGRGGANFDYDGGQIAAYGGWDNTRSYFRNIVSYGFYGGSSHRDVGIGSSPVDPNGNYNADVWSYYGEVGHRFAVVDEVSATPFFGLGLASAGLDAFTEKDPQGTGAGLRIKGTNASSTATHLGVRVNGQWGGFSPELSLAWRHEFDDTRQTVNAAFASGPKGANFKVKSSDPGADALLLGLGGAYDINGKSDIMVRYDGAFYDGYQSHAGTVRWTTKF